MKQTDLLSASSFLIKRAAYYKPFDFKDSLVGGLAAAAVGGLGGAALGKASDVFSDEEEPSGASRGALIGAAALGLPVALAPLLVSDNPVGRAIINAFYKQKLMEKIPQNAPPEVRSILEKATRGGVEKLPHSVKSLPFRNAKISLSGSNS